MHAPVELIVRRLSVIFTSPFGRGRERAWTFSKALTAVSTALRGLFVARSRSLRHAEFTKSISPDPKQSSVSIPTRPRNVAGFLFLQKKRVCMPVPFWAGHYIGLPFQDHGRDRSGLDCCGLVRLVMSEQFGIALPSYVHEYQRTTQVEKIGDLVEREASHWTPVAAEREICGDAIVLRVRGRPMHVGVVLGDRQMLHIEHGINSVIESYAGLRWAERVSGFYRYKGFASHDGVSPDDPEYD